MSLRAAVDIDDERDADTKDNRPAKPVAAAPKPQSPASGLTRPCEIHNVQMGEHISKTGKPYFGHKMEDGKWCFGR
jgi:hypothetical protein